MDINLQALLDELARESGDLAAYLSGTEGITYETLGSLEDEALKSFDQIRKAEGAPSEDDVNALEAIAEAVKAVRAERGNRDEAQAKIDAKVDSLAAEIAPADGNDDGDQGDTEPETDTEPATEGSEPSDAEPETDTAPAVEVEPTVETNGGDSVTAPEAAPAGDLVTASASEPAKSTRRKVKLADFASRVPRPEPTSDGAIEDARMLVAAADVPGTPSGKRFDSWREIGEAALRRFGAMPRGRSGGKPLQYELAQVEKPRLDGLVASGGSSDQEVIDYAARESRLDGGSLTASGAWCGPADRWTDLCGLDIDLTGLFELPSITVNRGRVEYQQGPDYCQILPIVEQGFFRMTAAQVEAGEEKPCVEVPCPDDLEECVLEVFGLCITAGILTQRSYPEWVSEFIRFALAAHEIRMSDAQLQEVYERSTDIGTVPGGPSATASVLNAINYQVQWIRARNRTNQTLELIAPDWIREVIRNDLAKRDGMDYLEVSDQRITSWFTSRGVRVQWLRQWQKLADCPDESAESPGDLQPYPPTDVPPNQWPSQAEFLIYPAGTWVAARQDVINLSTIYDSNLLRTNRYTALFSEEAMCVIQRCNGSWKFAVDLCPNGATAERLPVECPIL